ncbi:MAG: hypothetical protein ACYTG0_32600, partial [Planctomycetota bacterium]
PPPASTPPSQRACHRLLPFPPWPGTLVDDWRRCPKAVNCTEYQIDAGLSTVWAPFIEGKKGDLPSRLGVNPSHPTLHPTFSGGLLAWIIHEPGIWRRRVLSQPEA